jgi:hypothetical protein
MGEEATPQSNSHHSSLTAPIFPDRLRECRREVDEFTAIAEKWGYWSDGCRELLPFCPECASREFAPDAPASGRLLGVLRRDRQ